MSTIPHLHEQFFLVKANLSRRNCSCKWSFTLFNKLWKLSYHHFFGLMFYFLEYFLLAGLISWSILGSLDIKYIGKLNSFLAPVLRSSSRSRFVKCWHAKTDGWAASTFHSNCDGKGPTVTIIQVGSYIFGGYTDVSWFGKYLFNFRAGFFQFVNFIINGKQLFSY